MLAEGFPLDADERAGETPDDGTSFAKPIIDDLYCPLCGYNLRGLGGNPVRCPECGEQSDRRIITIPAELIRPALRKMETAPATCVGISIVALLIAMPLISLDEPGFVFLGAPFGIAWLASYWRTQEVFGDRRGWRSIVRDFHLAAFCWSLAVFFFLFMLSAVLWGTISIWAFLACNVPVIGLFPLGMFVYRRARSTICALQRRQAVEMMKLTIA